MPRTRRQFLTQTLAGAAAGCGIGLRSSAATTAVAKVLPMVGKAKTIIMIYLPGGVAQQDTWDPKLFTPFSPGMKGSELLSTCRSIPTAADGIRLGAGLEKIAEFMDRAAIIRSLNTTARFGAGHLKAQFYSMTGYLEPVGLNPPSLGSIVARTLGPRHPHVPAYIYTGLDLLSAGTDVAKRKAIEFTGPGFYGSKYAPFRVADPSRGLSTLNALTGMSRERIDRRLDFLHEATRLAGADQSAASHEFLRTLDSARAMMDSPVKRAFNYLNEESPELIANYEPRTTTADLFDPGYDYGKRFGHGLLLARRLVESGARFVQVEYQYGPFKGFDMHESGGRRMEEMKRQIDGPIAQLLRDLESRGLLDETLVVIESEFGRTIQSAPADNFGGKAGAEPAGASETHDGSNVVIADEGMYGLHGHLSTNHSVVLFGAGVRGGTVYGKTAERHPMVPIENAVALPDIHATIFQALGIPADHSYVTEKRPFYVTKDGTGSAIDEVLA